MASMTSMNRDRPTTYTYPDSADRYYAIVEGRKKVPIISENAHAIAFEDGSDDDTTRISIIPKDPISSLHALDFSDALRWMGMLEAIREIPHAMKWGETDGFRLDTPCHPPYQREPWLRMRLTRSKSKVTKGDSDGKGYTRDIGHFKQITELHRRVEVVYANDEFMVFHDVEDEDNDKYDHVLVGIPRRQVVTILDDDYTMQDWLSLVAGIREAAVRLGVAEYTTYMNIRPPYQHTAWVHVHMLAGGKALDGTGSGAKDKEHKDKKA
jgi:diadenosine tetraphosphate (Ap4A) HIT family hydrolase